MSDYRVYPAINTALGSLTVLNPQPRSEGVKPTQRSFGLGGVVWEQGLYIELIYDFLETPAEVASVYGDYGLDVDKQSSVTIYAPDDMYVYRRYNGVAIRPVPSWNNYFPRSVSIVVGRLVLI